MAKCNGVFLGPRPNLSPSSVEIGERTGVKTLPTTCLLQWLINQWLIDFSANLGKGVGDKAVRDR